jgi:DNA-binding protein HU-beta
MNKGQLVDRLADRTGLPRPQADAVIRALFDPQAGIIAGELRDGGKVDLPAFGRFGTRERAARTGKNPSTGRTISIPARRACVFTPRKGLRSSMKDKIGA